MMLSDNIIKNKFQIHLSFSKSKFGIKHFINLGFTCFEDFPMDIFILLLIISIIDNKGIE